MRPGQPRSSLARPGQPRPSLARTGPARLDLARLAAAPDDLSWLGPPRLGPVRLVAVDGPSGSGKSTLAADLAAATAVPTAIVSTDDFATWDDPVAWWPRLTSGVLEPLAAGRPGRYVRTAWVDGRPGPGAEVTVEVPAILIVEGVSAGRRSIRSTLSCLIWCEHPDRVERLERAVRRDGEASREPLETWQNFEQTWFTVDGTKSAADYTR